MPVSGMLVIWIAESGIL